MLVHWQRGFSLAEMAIVLVIVGVLMASGLGALSSQMSNQRLKETKQMLERANEALIGFALANNRLPCPADSAGLEARNSSGANINRCVSAYGDLPWQSLGLPELDSWGRKFKYQVTTYPVDIKNDFAGMDKTSTPNCGLSALKPCFGLEDAGNIAVHSASTRDGVGVTSRKLVGDAAAVIFSEGPNGAGTSEDELENRGVTAQRFVQDTPDANFDDILVWLPTTQLMYRLATAERLP
jgi:prepilin-type N-terminal cleavage/methylation domain-containing protein